MVIGLPVRERRVVLRAEDDQMTPLEVAWRGRTSEDFDVNPDDGKCLVYENEIAAETPESIRAKCAAILADRRPTHAQ